ncbi:MAG TPA: oligosaccharide flippase family protein [Nitrospirota bacterium]|nr:oligosaccharide flippase family protein [Nitrospirota bacterium]
MKVLWFKILETSGAKIYGILTGIVYLFLTARFLGPEGRGSIASVLVWVGLFATISGLSLGQVVQYHIQGKRYQEWLPNTLGTLMCLSILLSLFAYGIAYLVFQTTEGQVFKNIPISVLLLGFTMLPFIMWEEYGSFLLSAAGSLRAYNIAQVIGRSSSVCVIVLLAFWRRLDVTNAIAALSGGQIILGLIACWVLWKLSGYVMHIDTRAMKAFLYSAAKLHVNTVAAFLLVQSNILMLNHFCTKAEVGWYQLSFQMILMMLVIPQAASLVLYAEMAEVGPDKLWPRQKQLGMQVLLLMVVLSCIAYFISQPLISILAGTSFAPSIKVFRLLLPVLIGMTIASLLANQWIGRGLFLPTTIVTLVTAIVNIAINFYAIPKYGMMGAVWSMLLSFAILTVVIQLCFVVCCEKKYKNTRNNAVKPSRIILPNAPSVSRPATETKYHGENL